MSSLYKRCRCDDPKACAHAWWYRYHVHGREVRVSTRTPHKPLALRIGQKAHLSALEQRAGLATIQSPILSQHIAAYCADTEKRNKTAYKDRAVLDALLAVTGDRRLSEITPFQIARWMSSRAKEVSQATVNRELTIIRACFSKAVQWRKLAISPVTTVKAYRVDGTRLRILTPDEIQAVLTSAPGPVQLLCRVTLGSLLRLSEARQLHRHDIGPSWLAVTRKGGKVQRVPATADLCAALKAACHPVSGYVFGTGKKGTLPTQQTATNWVIRRFAALDIDGASHHTLRHTGASAMIAAGHSIRVVQLIGGWSNLRMLERYTHPTGSELQAAVATVSVADSRTKPGTAMVSPLPTVAKRARRKA